MSEASALIDFTIRFAKKLMVESSATLDLSLNSAARTIRPGCQRALRGTSSVLR